MLRWLLRLIGYLCLAAGFITFVVDGARYVANNAWTPLRLGPTLSAVMPRAYGSWETAAKARLPGVLWDPGLVTALTVPFFIVATVLGALLLLLGRKPKALIGYSNRD